MRDSSSSNRHFGSALILFALSALIALLLMVVAFVVWLAEMMSSMTGALLLTGGVFALIAAVVYLFSLHEAFRQVASRLDTIYDVARAVQWGYRLVGEQLARWLK